MILVIKWRCIYIHNIFNTAQRYRVVLCPLQCSRACEIIGNEKKASSTAKLKFQQIYHDVVIVICRVDLCFAPGIEFICLLFIFVIPQSRKRCTSNKFSDRSDGRLTSLPFLIMSDQPTNQQTDIRVNREVTL